MVVRNDRDGVVTLGISGSSPVRFIDGSITEENATANVSITNVAPAAVGTATISKWLKIDIGGIYYFIPMWT